MSITNSPHSIGISCTSVPFRLQRFFLCCIKMLLIALLCTGFHALHPNVCKFPARCKCFLFLYSHIWKVTCLRNDFWTQHACGNEAQEVSKSCSHVLYPHLVYQFLNGWFPGTARKDITNSASNFPVCCKSYILDSHFICQACNGLFPDTVRLVLMGIRRFLTQ